MPNLRQNASLPQLNVHSKNIINLTVEGCFIHSPLSKLNTENVSIYVNKSSNDLFWSLSRIHSFVPSILYNSPCFDVLLPPGGATLLCLLYWEGLPQLVVCPTFAGFALCTTPRKIVNHCWQNVGEVCLSIYVLCPNFQFTHKIYQALRHGSTIVSASRERGLGKTLKKLLGIKLCIFTSRLEMLWANRNCFQIKPILVI